MIDGINTSQKAQDSSYATVRTNNAVMAGGHSSSQSYGNRCMHLPNRQVTVRSESVFNLCNCTQAQSTSCQKWSAAKMDLRITVSQAKLGYVKLAKQGPFTNSCPQCCLVMT